MHRATETGTTAFHKAKIHENTRLFRLFGASEINVNSIHHQAIKKLADGLEVMAIADDGIIEAVCLNGEQYLCAFQWHPERLYESDIYNHRIFDDFIEACS